MIRFIAVHLHAIACPLGSRLAAVRSYTTCSEQKLDKITNADLNQSIQELCRKIEGVELKVEGVKQQVSAEVKDLRRNMEGVEQRVSAEVKDLRQNVEGVERQMKDLCRNVEGVERRTSAEAKDLRLQVLAQGKGLHQGFKSVNACLDAMIHGVKRMGAGMELLMGLWISEILKLTGHPDAVVESGAHFKDPEKTVFGSCGTSDIEIDVICRDPLVLAETTVYVDTNEAKKACVFLRKVQLVEEQEGKKATNLYFVTAGIHWEVELEVREILVKGGAMLLVGEVDLERFLRHHKKKYVLCPTSHHSINVPGN